jgi:hypothetical protein
VHPFSRLSHAGRRQAFTLLLLLVLALSTFLMVLGEPLRTPAAPQGIVSFELAGSGAAAAAILDSWSPGVRELAMLNLGLDYLYLVAYPALLSLACFGVAGRLRERSAGLARIGIALSWAVLAAGVLDAIENAALIRIVASGPSDALARAAWLAAVPKFALVLAGLAYALGGFVWSLLRRTSAPDVR